MTQLQVKEVVKTRTFSDMSVKEEVLYPMSANVGDKVVNNSMSAKVCGEGGE